jgi:hypothetical protein
MHDLDLPAQPLGRHGDPDSHRKPPFLLLPRLDRCSCHAAPSVHVSFETVPERSSAVQMAYSFDRMAERRHCSNSPTRRWPRRKVSPGDFRLAQALARTLSGELFYSEALAAQGLPAKPDWRPDPKEERQAALAAAPVDRPRLFSEPHRLLRSLVPVPAGGLTP